VQETLTGPGGCNFGYLLLVPEFLPTSSLQPKVSFSSKCVLDEGIAIPPDSGLRGVPKTCLREISHAEHEEMRFILYDLNAQGAFRRQKTIPKPDMTHTHVSLLAQGARNVDEDCPLVRFSIVGHPPGCHFRVFVQTVGLIGVGKPTRRPTKTISSKENMFL